MLEGVEELGPRGKVKKSVRMPEGAEDLTARVGECEEDRESSPEARYAR